MDNRQFTEQLLTGLDNNYHKYIISVNKISNKLLGKNSIEELHIFKFTYQIEEILKDFFAVQIDLNKMFKNKLGYKDKNIKNNIERLKKFDIITAKKNSDFFIMDNHLNLLFKSPQKCISFFNRVKNLEKEREILENKFLYYKKFHYNKFMTKTLLNQELNNFDYCHLSEIKDLFIIDTPDLLTQQNIDLERIKPDLEHVRKHIKSEMFEKIDNEFKQIRYFNKHLHFKNNNFFFKYLEEIGSNSTILINKFYHSHWHELGDTGFLFKIESELKKFEYEHFFEPKKFILNNNKFFLNFEKEKKDALLQEFSKYTIEDVILKSDPLKEMLSLYQEFKKYVLANEKLIEESKSFSGMSKKYTFITGQRAFTSQINERLNKLNVFKINDFLELMTDSFVREVDISPDKIYYKSFLEFDYVSIKSDIFLNQLKDGLVDFSNQDNSYLEFLNSYGGFFLLMFDLINMKRGVSNDFCIYTQLAPKLKFSEIRHQKRALFLIFLISTTLFNGEMEDDTGYFVEVFLKNKKIFNNKENENTNELEEFYIEISQHTSYFKKLDKMNHVLLNFN